MVGPTVNMETAERIRRIRVEYAGLDQRRFAERLGVTPAAVAQWELGGSCARANLERICAEFRISHEWLFLGRGHPVKFETVSFQLRLLTDDRLAEAEAFVNNLLEAQKTEEIRTNKTRS